MSLPALVTEAVSPAVALVALLTVALLALAIAAGLILANRRLTRTNANLVWLLDRLDVRNERLGGANTQLRDTLFNLPPRGRLPRPGPEVPTAPIPTAAETRPMPRVYGKDGAT